MHSYSAASLVKKGKWPGNTLNGIKKGSRSNAAASVMRLQPPEHVVSAPPSSAHCQLSQPLDTFRQRGRRAEPPTGRTAAAQLRESTQGLPHRRRAPSSAAARSDFGLNDFLLKPRLRADGAPGTDETQVTVP